MAVNEREVFPPNFVASPRMSSLPIQSSRMGANTWRPLLNFMYF